MTPRARFERWWEQLWFQTIPPHTYAVLRVTFGMLGLLHLAGTTPVGVFWDASGLIPLPGGGSGLRAWLVDAGLGTAAGWTFFCVSAAAFGAMTLGVRSHAAVVLAFLVSMFQARWNPLPLSLSHQVLASVLFTLIWADCGQVLSLGRSRGPFEQQPIWPLRLLQFQVALIYLNSGLWKLLGSAWRDGTAIYYAMAHDLFQRFPGGVPPVPFWLTAAGTYLTLVWEIGFPALVLWRRTRALALGVGVVIHLGAWVALELGPFSWMMLGTYVAFLDPVRVAQIVGRFDTPARREAASSAPPEWNAAGPAGR